MTDHHSSQNRTADELRRSEDRFRSLASIVSEGVLIHSDGVVIDANQAFVAIIGLNNPSDLIGSDGLKAIPFTPESRRKLQDHIKAGSTETYEIEIYRPDGSILTAETSGREIEYMGRTARLVSMRDISEQKRSTEALLERELAYHEIFNATSDALIIHDSNGLILDVNDRMCSLFCCTRETALGRDASEFSLGESPYSAREAQEHMQRAVSRGPQTFFWRNKRADGDLFWSEVALRACVIGGKSLVIASIRDVSERKKAEDDLANEKRFADALFESLPGVAYVYDEIGKIVRWNRTFEMFFAPPGEKLEPGGMHVLETIAEADRGHIEEVINEINRKGYGEAEFHVLTGEGVEVPFRGSARIAEYGGRRYLVGVGFDQTANVQAEAEKTELEHKLRHTTKMQAVGQLAGGLAHDFNNLLTVIAGNVELAKTEINSTDPLLAYLNQVQQAATSAAELTRQLLAFSRHQILEPKPLNLNDLIAHVSKMLTRLIGENIEIRMETEEDLSIVIVDTTQFEQVLVNLAVNARDAMPEGGQIVIETANIELGGDPHSLPPDLQAGPFVRLTVTDTGIGMSAEVKERIFEPFFTTKAKGRGTGLGMATIFGAVKQAGGAIEIESALGHGTTVKIYLPRLESQVATGIGEGTISETPRGNETVLVVEDDAHVRLLAVVFLERLGYLVLKAKSGSEALTLATEHDGPIDLVLTDVVMPGLNGRETMQALFALRPELKVLYMSGYPGDIIDHQGGGHENLDFIAKPFDLKNLARKLRSVIDSD